MNGSWLRRMAGITGTVCLLLWPRDSLHAKGVFTELQYNPHWYRTYDSASDILPTQGALLFNWKFADSEKYPDSFYVGIDTLWGLPQDVGADTAADWDLQVCPDEICLNGLKAGVHGANAPNYFDSAKFATEHHFQFFPAIDGKTYDFISPLQSIFGGMMFCRSRTTGAADTVLGFGAWKMAWDTNYLPPVRPVNGYLPKLADFVIANDTVRYIKGAEGIHARSGLFRPTAYHGLGVSVGEDGIRLSFPGIPYRKSIRFYRLDGTRLGAERAVPTAESQLFVPRAALKDGMNDAKIVLVALSWNGGTTAKAVPLLVP